MNPSERGLLLEALTKHPHITMEAYEQTLEEHRRRKLEGGRVLDTTPLPPFSFADDDTGELITLTDSGFAAGIYSFEVARMVCDYLRRFRGGDVMVLNWVEDICYPLTTPIDPNY